MSLNFGNLLGSVLQKASFDIRIN